MPRGGDDPPEAKAVALVADNIVKSWVILDLNADRTIHALRDIKRRLAADFMSHEIKISHHQ